MLEYYKSLLGPIPEFLNKYLEVPSLLRLKQIGYFCGMDYASKDIYDFKEYISRYDHSLTVALLTSKLSNSKEEVLSALFHDIATPCFSHVIDYMNKDYEKQESTEEYTEKILRNDEYLNKCLKQDNIDINDIIDFKKYSIVDNDRPKLCADRLDGIILTGSCWTKNVKESDIKDILDNIEIYRNEECEKEIGFKSIETYKRVIDINNEIDIYCHSNEDNYMMELLANITKLLLDRNYISYNDLYYYNEDELFNLLYDINDKKIKKLLLNFKTIKKDNIPNIDIPNLKTRTIKPLIKCKRM